MLRQARSSTSQRNSLLTPLKRMQGELNSQWSVRAIAQMGTTSSRDWTYVALIGGNDTMAFRLRVAQSHLRDDLLPSFWSDSILVELIDDTVENAQAIHVPLTALDSLEFAPRNNGVAARLMCDFDDPQRYPNIALIAIPVTQAEILLQIERFKKSRSTLDALEHVLRWLAFAWGVAGTPNPLHENFGIPSACMLETVCAAANFDLTPGLESRASCPEAIWIAAGHWQDYFKQFHGRAPVGRYFAPHRYPIVEP